MNVNLGCPRPSYIIDLMESIVSYPRANCFELTCASCLISCPIGVYRSSLGQPNLRRVKEQTCSFVHTVLVTAMYI